MTPSRRNPSPQWAVCAFMAALLVAARGSRVIAEGEYINLLGALIEHGARSGVRA